MYILLCGKQGTGKTTVAEQLKSYYSYRGTACYSYDFMQPIHEAHDAVFISLNRYGLEAPPNDVYHKEPYQLLYGWLEGYLPAFMEKTISPVITRWDELKMYHITVIQGMTKKEHLDRYPHAFKVLLTCDADERKKRSMDQNESSAYVRDNNSPIEMGFNDYAVCDIFDLVVDTGTMSPDRVASHIGETLHGKLFGGVAPSASST